MKRRLNDIEKIREGMFERAKKSVNDLFPITNEAGRLEVENLHYRGDPPSKSDEKGALHRNESIGWDLRGDMVLRDAEGNEIDRRSRRIARIPYMTGRGTFIYNGNDYAIANQAKLKPGVYTRISRSGKMQAPIQTEGGPNMKLELDPGSGELRLRMHQASLKLYPLLRASGMEDDQIRSYIGDAALEANKSNLDTRAEGRVAEKITGDRNLDNLGERVRETLSGYGLDPGITKHTIGTAHENMSPEMLAETAGELTRLLKGESDPSPRDALYAQRVRSPEIQLDDQIQSGRYKLARRLWKAINKKSLDAVPAGVLDDRVNGLFFETGLASPLEEYNPLEAHDQMQRITRGGAGGLSGHAVPEESRYIHPTQLGFIDPVRTPESGSIGLDMRSAIDTYVDDDGELYTIMENAKTGETETVAAKDLKDLTVSWPDQKEQKTPVAVKKGRKIGLANSEDVDYYIPSGEQQHSDMTTLSPMLGTAHVGRGLMSGKFALQALPLATREEPLVQAAEEAGDGTIEQRLGRYAGAEHAPASGTVREVADDRIVIETPEGDTREVELYRDFPLNRKTSLHQEPAVQAGDAVEAGDLVATSNFTDPTGKVSLGTNLRTAFLPSGNTFEDAVAVRAGAARDKLRARLMKTKEVSTEGKTEAGKGQYLSSFPQKYEKAQLDKIGDEGTVQVGETVQPGDPLILATGSPEKDPYYYSLRKTSPKSTDRSVEWDQDTEGKVIDVVHTDSGPKVYVETEKGAIQGDKLGTRFGGKGIMTVIPDDEMPRDKDGNPVDLLISPLATTSRKNPGLAEEAMLGKLARHRGEPIPMDLLSKSDDEESVNATAKGMLREEGLSPEEDLVDPKTGKTIKNVLTGDIYGYRLTHTAKGKGKARSLGGHTASGLPSTGGESGGKKISRQPLNALLSHGALDVIEESQKLKGASNPEVWDELRAGKDIKMPDIPYANRKLFDLLKGAGVNVKRKNNNLHIMPLRDSEVEEMSNGEITSSEMLDRKTMRPKPGSEGLFDPAITGGPGGDMWSHLELPYAIPNPTMERPIARLLEIPQKGVREVMTGERKINGKTGPEALQGALRGLDVGRQMRNLKSSLPNMSKTARDRATKRLRHLRMLDRYDIKPEDMMISKVPVLPPKARPISDLPGLDAPVMESSNMLYKDLIDLKNAIAETDLPEEEMGQYRGDLYDAAKSVYGLGDPVSRASQEKGLTGILKTVFGDSPKHSYLQSNVASKPQNMSGLAVISPNNELAINEVGMPRSLAREAYEPMIIRKMVKQGMTPVAAMRELKNESPRAEKALKEAVEDRPVIVNRAPTLHRGGMVALWPRLHDGETLETSPPLVDTMGGDYDGDTMLFHVPLTDEAVKNATEKMLPTRNLINPRRGESVYNPTKELAMGLWLATRETDEEKPAQEFTSRKKAIQAMRKGEIDPDQPVRILG